jgi:protein KRI1
MDAFEAAYNFRYEEPGANSIVTHKRNAEASVRVKDSSRKKARQAANERKEAENVR